MLENFKHQIVWHFTAEKSKHFYTRQIHFGKNIRFEACDQVKCGNVQIGDFVFIDQLQRCLGRKWFGGDDARSTSFDCITNWFHADAPVNRIRAIENAVRIISGGVLTYWLPKWNGDTYEKLLKKGWVWTHLTDIFIELLWTYFSTVPLFQMSKVLRQYQCLYQFRLA